MYDEYAKAYRHYSVKYGADTAIFYMVGKFYEVYDTVDGTTSARRMVDLLGIQCSIKKGAGPKGADAIFAGIPEQSLHKYAQILTRSNWTVVVIDQVKDVRGNVVERRASRILTPGTHTEAATADALYIAGIWLEPGPWGSREPPTFALVAADLTTGRLHTYEGTATGKAESWTADDAFHFFQVHPAREAIVWWRGDTVAAPSPESLKRQLGVPAARIQVLPAAAAQQGALELPLVREDLLRRSIPVQTLLPLREALGLAGSPTAERALCCLLTHLEEVFPSAPKHLHVPERWAPLRNLYLGNQALVQLNFLMPQMQDSVLGLFQRTQTTLGRRAMRNRLLHPTADAAVLEWQYNEIGQLLALPDAVTATLKDEFRVIADLSRIHWRLGGGDATPADLVALGQSYRAAGRIAALLADTLLRPERPETLAELDAGLQDIFDLDRAAEASEDAYCFQLGVAPAVEAVEEAIRGLQQQMRDVVEKVRIWAGVPEGALRLEFRETLGPVIGGPKAAMTVVKGRLATAAAAPVQGGLHMNQKKSGLTAELPELDRLWRDLQSKRQELAAAVRAALPDLCEALSDRFLARWEEAEEWVAATDVAFTLASTSRDLGFVRPELLQADETGASVEITGLRHPLIELACVRTEYVTHDVKLGPGQNGWLVYGMNASGKSSLMKAVGIAVLLAQAGCYVPATAMRLRPFRSLFTRILNTDNLWAGLSSFAVEMTELRDILNRADRWSLVLGDELCSGTESQSATALVGAGLQWLTQRGARFIFATHLHDLMSLKEVVTLSLEGLRVYHLKVRYDHATDRLIYERLLSPGSGSSLYGLEVARAMNLPADLLMTAHAMRRSLLGTAADAEAPTSSWNSGMTRRACEVCSSAITRDLEVHHIRPRASVGPTGRLPDGSDPNHARNLIVVCAACHDRHHNGELAIGPLQQTSDGPVRQVEALAPMAAGSLPRTKWTEEQSQLIETYLRKFTALSPKRVSVMLQEKEGIRISEGSLRALRSKLL